MSALIRLRHLAQVNPPSPRFDSLADDDEVTFLPMEAVWPGERLDKNRLRPKADVSTGYTRFQDGDVLLPKITPTFEAGRAVLIDGLHNGAGAGTTELHILRPGRYLEARYLFYLVNTHGILKLGEAEMYGVAGQKRVPDEFLRKLELELPGLDEQRRIADFLDAETARIDQLTTVQARLKSVLWERRTASVLNEVTGLAHAEREPTGLAWVDSLPRSWQVVRLGLIAHMGSGHTPSRSRPEWWTDCTIPWITTGEVAQVRDDRKEAITETREKISKIGLANSAAELCPAGTVVLCRTASAGYSAVMGVEMATSQDFVTWQCGPRLDPYYLLWCLRAMRDDLQGRLATGSTHLTIYVPDLQMLRIPLPPIDEQRAIVDRIRQSNARIDRLIDAIDRQLALLAERRQALITAAVTGQLDVTTARGADVT